MATRDKPNSYFAWYNDDDRLAIVERQRATDDSKGVVSGEYDSYLSAGNLSGTITQSSTGAGSTVQFTSASHGLAVDDTVTISDTTSYDGDETVTVVGDANTFTVSATNSESSETGTWVSLFIDDGLRMTYKSNYETVTAITEDLDTDIGLDTGLHPSFVCYMKSRLYEDQGNFEQASYFRNMYETQMMKVRSRKSGVRSLTVPTL